MKTPPAQLALALATAALLVVAAAPLGTAESGHKTRVFTPPYAIGSGPGHIGCFTAFPGESILPACTGLVWGDNRTGNATTNVVMVPSGTPNEGRTVSAYLVHRFQLPDATRAVSIEFRGDIVAALASATEGASAQARLSTTAFISSCYACTATQLRILHDGAAPAPVGPYVNALTLARADGGTLQPGTVTFTFRLFALLSSSDLPGVAAVSAEATLDEIRASWTPSGSDSGGCPPRHGANHPGPSHGNAKGHYKGC